MERLNLNERIKGSKNVEEGAKNAFLDFFADLWKEELEVFYKDKDEKEKKKLIDNHVKVENSKVIVDTSYVDPRKVFLDAYCVLSKKALDILTNLGEDYIEVNKESTKVKGLKRHKKIIADIYHITLKEDYSYFKGGVTIHATLNSTPGAYDFIKLAFLEDEIYYTRACLDAYDLKF